MTRTGASSGPSTQYLRVFRGSLTRSTLSSRDRLPQLRSSKRRGAGRPGGKGTGRECGGAAGHARARHTTVSTSATGLRGVATAGGP